MSEPLSVGDLEPNAVDLDSLLTHEAGHLLGLGHTRDPAATMYPGYELGSVELRTLAADDVAGVCSIYPPKRHPSSTSCEPRHGFSDLCGADQPAPGPEVAADSSASGCSFSLRRTSPVGALVLFLLLAFGLRRKRRLVAASLTTAALAGCSLDARQLQRAAESAGQAGASSPTLPSAGSDQGGAAAADAGDPSMIDGCTDLDEESRRGLRRNASQERDVKTDVDAWQVDAEAQLAWNERNAASDLPSGSALLSATGAVDPALRGSLLQSASQCLEITGKQLVTVYANALVDSDQSSSGFALVDVQLFDSNACTGAFVTAFRPRSLCTR